MEIPNQLYYNGFNNNKFTGNTHNILNVFRRSIVLVLAPVRVFILKTTILVYVVLHISRHIMCAHFFPSLLLRARTFIQASRMRCAMICLCTTRQHTNYPNDQPFKRELMRLHQAQQFWKCNISQTNYRL